MMRKVTFVVIMFVLVTAVVASCHPRSKPTTTTTTKTEGEEGRTGEGIGERALPTPTEPTRERFLPSRDLGTVYFDFDRSDLRSDAIATLDKNVSVLRANADKRVKIEGHCDERGTIEYNFYLGQRRADAVKNYLIKSGISASRLETISFGEEKSADPGHSEEAWAKNRRAQFSEPE